MRIARFAFVLLAVVVMAQPVFACWECQDDCVFVLGSSDGCRPLPSGCTTARPCGQAARATQAAAEWSIASVEVTHSTPAAAPARKDSRVVVASAAPRPTNVR